MTVTLSCDVCGKVVYSGREGVLGALITIDVPEEYDYDSRHFPSKSYRVCRNCANEIAKAEYAGAMAKIAELAKK